MLMAILKYLKAALMFNGCFPTALRIVYKSGKLAKIKYLTRPYDRGGGAGKLVYSIFVRDGGVKNLKGEKCQKTITLLSFFFRICLAM